MIIRNFHLWGDFDLYPIAWLKYAGYNGALWVFRNRWLMSMLIDQSGVCKSKWRTGTLGPLGDIASIACKQVTRSQEMQWSWTRKTCLLWTRFVPGMLDPDDQTSDKQITARQRDQVVSLMVSKSDWSSFDGSAGTVKDCNQVQLTSHWSKRVSRSCLLFPRP